MYSSSSSNIIFVGNIQSIKDEQLREYFQRFGKIEAFYHNCTCAADEWLIDYRFIRFSSDTDMSVFLTNKIDHIICRIRLDIYPYDAALRDETRLILDRKICIAHTDSKLDRNVIKKAFTKYGRILNCTCTSSGNGVEYVYIEFESINSVRSVFTSGQRHFAGKTPLAVKQPLRPSQVEVKTECISINEKEFREQSVSRCSHRQRINSNVDTAQYSSVLINRHNSIIEEELRTSNSLSQSLFLLLFRKF
jgi:RNA recognition motif-containing protein